MPRFTGERILPNSASLQYTFARHEVVYQAIAQHVIGRNIIDCGCGEGYGSSMMAQQAASVTGIDRSSATIAEATKKYIQTGLTFRRQDLETPWAFSEQTFDGATCCQVIEHLRQPKLLLNEMARVLKPHGWAVLSTPNRTTFSPTGDMLDPYHWQEYTRSEYEALLRQVFPEVKIFALTGNQRVLDHLRQDMSFIRKIVGLDILQARTWLPMSIKRWLYNLGLNTVRRFQTTRRAIEPVTVKDFRITAEVVPENEVLDLIAVCGHRPEDLPNISST